MKGWAECPKCWGTGFVKGFGASCVDKPPDREKFVPCDAKFKVETSPGIKPSRLDEPAGPPTEDSEWPW